MYLVTIGEMSNEWDHRWEYVGGRCISGQKIACHAGVENGPSLDGDCIGCNGLKEDGGCKHVIGGGGRVTAVKINGIVYFISTVTRP